MEFHHSVALCNLFLNKSEERDGCAVDLRTGRDDKDALQTLEGQYANLFFCKLIDITGSSGESNGIRVVCSLSPNSRDTI